MTARAGAGRGAAAVVPVEMTTADGLVLRGEVRGAGSDWVLLLHDLGQDLDAWGFLSAGLASAGSAVLAVDLRGHGGSDGSPDAGTVADDAEAAARFARGHGARRVFVGSAGAAARRIWAAAADLGLSGLFLLSPSGPPGHELRAPIPKLLVVGSADPAWDGAVTSLQRAAVGPTVVVRLPVRAQGLGLLGTPWGGHVLEQVTAFLSNERRKGERR